MKNNKIQKRKNQLDSYVKYSSLAFQMGGTIALFSWLGMKTDEWQATEQPYYTIAFSLVGVFLSLYLVLKGLLKK
jgi:ATP synthase protein I